jgi:hypothetical protein
VISKPREPTVETIWWRNWGAVLKVDFFKMTIHVQFKILTGTYWLFSITPKRAISRKKVNEWLTLKKN